MKVSTGPRLGLEGELLVTCLECGRRWKIEADCGPSALMFQVLEDQAEELRDHECRPLPRLVAN